MTEPVAEQSGGQSLPWTAHLRRIAGRLLVALVVLAGIALLVAHSGWAKEKLRMRAEAKFTEMLNGSVSIGSLDYGFLFKDLQLREVKIRDANGAIVIQLATLNADVARWESLRERLTLDRLQLSEMRFKVDVDADGNDNLRQLFRKEQGGSAALSVRAIEVDSLTFAVCNAGGKVVELSELRLRASVRRDQFTELVLNELETDVFIQIGKRQSIAGHVSQRGARLRLDGERLQLQFEPLHIELEFRRDGFPTVDTEVILGTSSLSQSPGRLVVELVDAVIGPLRVGAASLALATRQGRLQGDQRVSLREISVDPMRLGALLGRELQMGMARGQLEISGPADAMVISGAFATPEGDLKIVGEVNATGPRAPVYSVETTTNIRLDMAGALPRPAIVLRTLLPTLFRIDVQGTGFPQLDGRIDLHVEALSNDSDTPVRLLNLRAHLAKQSLQLDSLTLNFLGTELEAGGHLDTEGFGVGATLAIHGDARQTVAHLRELGLQVPRDLQLPSRLNLNLELRGNFSDRIVVTLAPSETAIAGGTVMVGGQAEFAAAPQGMEFVSARGAMTLRQLKLDSIARLAKRRAPFAGTVNGTLDLDLGGEKRRIAHRLRIDMPAQDLSLHIEGAMTNYRWQGRVSATNLRGGPELAWLEGRLPLREELRLSRTEPMELRAKIPTTVLAEHLHRLPPTLQELLGSLVQDLEGELSVALRGTLRRPAGHIELAARGNSPHAPALPLEIAIKTEIVSDKDGTVHLLPAGTLHVAGDGRPALVVGGELRLRDLRKYSPDERVILQLQFDVPERSLAELAAWSQAPDTRWRTLPGEFDAQLRVENTLANPRLELSAKLVEIANGAGSSTALVASAHADRDGGALKLRYGVDNPVRVTLNAKREGATLEIQAQTQAASIRLAELVPSVLADLVPDLVPPDFANEARLDSDLAFDARLEVTEGRVHPRALNLAGAIGVQLKSLVLPQTSRTYRDIKLALAGKGDVVSAKLELSERDAQERARHLEIAGTLALRSKRGWGLSKLAARIRAHRWLLFGGAFGRIDAPRATLDADISVLALFSGSVPVVDITANSLAYSEPDRADFTHGTEDLAPFGDVVFSDESSIPLGKLGPPTSAAPSQDAPMRALARVHLPVPIHVAKGPLTLAMQGDVELPIGFGDGPSGHLEGVDGAMLLFGQTFVYKEGDIRLGSHPTANLYFADSLPPDVARKLSRDSSGDKVIVHLQPIGDGPLISFLGAGNEDLIEAMSLLQTGQPFIRSEPDAPASSTVRAPQLMQPLMIAFVRVNIPRLDLFDRFAAWSNAYDSSKSYGQLRYLDAEKHLGDGATRLRWIARPERIGRSIAEVQLDRLFLDTPSLSLGVGARVGSRLGGGVGLFFEWSSED